MAKKAIRSANISDVFIGAGLAAVVLIFVVVAVLIITKGDQPDSRAQYLPQFTEHTFTEDFTTLNHIDTNETSINVSTAGEVTPGEALLYHGSFVHINSVDKGWQKIPTQKTSGDRMETAFKVGPDGDIYVVYGLGSPGVPSMELFFTKWDWDDERWEQMDGTPGYTNISQPLVPATYVIVGRFAHQNNVTFDENGYPMVFFDRRLGLYDVYGTRWCPTLSGGSWGDMNCSTVGPEIINSTISHATLHNVDLDADHNPHVIMETLTPATVGESNYSRYDKASDSWVTSTGNPGSEQIVVSGCSPTEDSTTLSAQMAITSDDEVYLIYHITAGPFDPPPLTLYGLKATFDNSLGTESWTPLDGNPSDPCPTQIATNMDRANGVFVPLIDPATNNPHVFWGDVSRQAWHTQWDIVSNSFKTQDGSPGQEIIYTDASSSYRKIIPDFDESDSNAPAVTQYNSTGSILAFRYSGWDTATQSWGPHVGRQDPEYNKIHDIITPFYNGRFDIGPDGTEYWLYGPSPGADEDYSYIYITRYLTERVDNDLNHLRSKPINTVGDPVWSVTLNWEGESRGFAGTDGPQPPVPFDPGTGRNIHTDIDCAASNNNGIDWFPVKIGSEFIFPTRGTNLLYKCDFDSGSLLDNPVMKTMNIDYKTLNHNPYLELYKSADTDGDGIYQDSGERVAPGDIIDYKIQVVNTGSGQADDVVVTDMIPEGTEYVPNSTTVNGQPVSDSSPGVSPLESGLDVGTSPAGTFFQTTWEGGTGQMSYLNKSKFDTDNLVNWREPEFLDRPTGSSIYHDQSFAEENFGRVLNEPTVSASETVGLDSALVLSDGRLFSAWSDADGNIIARIFDQKGNADPQFQISDPLSPTNPYRNELPIVKELSNGDLILVWQKNIYSALGLYPPYPPVGNTEIIMRRLDSSGSPLTGEIILLSEPASQVNYPTPPYPHGYATDYSFVSMNRQSGGSQHKSSVAVDSNDNVYVGFIRSSVSTLCHQAKIAKFDIAGNPLFSPQPEITMDIGGCNIMQAPSLAVNNSGEIGAIYTTWSVLPGGANDIWGKVYDSNGNSLTGLTPTNIYSVPAYGTNMGPLLSHGNNFYLVHSEYPGTGPCEGHCLQKFARVGSSINASPVTQISGSFIVQPALAIDSSREILFAVSPTGFIGIPYVMPFDLNFNPILDNGLLQGFAIGTLISIDENLQRIWTNRSSGEVYGNLHAYTADPQVHWLRSSTYDAGNITDWNDLSVTEELPVGTSIQYELSTGNTPAPDSSWTPWTQIYPNMSINPSLSGTRYAKYRITMDNTGAPDETPVLHDIAIGQAGPIEITYKVRVTENNTVIQNSASATSSTTGSTVYDADNVQNRSGSPSVEVVAGDDRIDTAIELSNKVYPNPLSANVVCLSRADDPVDALPGSPLCAELDGPILLNPPTTLDSRVSTEINRILPKGNTVYLLGRERALSEDVRTALEQQGYIVERIGGETRLETSARIAQKLQAITPNDVTVATFANAWTAADALSISSYASIKKSGQERKPILLTNPDKLSQEVIDFIYDNPSITTFYITGGTTAINSSIEQELPKLPQKPYVERIGGETRYHTTALIANKFFPQPTIVYAMSGHAFPPRNTSGIPVDALLAGIPASYDSAPLIYVPQKPPLPDPSIDYFTDHKKSIGKVYVIGGPNAVDPTVVDEINSLLQ